MLPTLLALAMVGTEPQLEVAPAPRPAVVVSTADVKEIWVFIENYSVAAGKMPTAKVVTSALVAAEAPSAALVKNGAITLTDTRTREGIWAYETRALIRGGLVVTAKGVEKMTADELERLLTNEK